MGNGTTVCQLGKDNHVFIQMVLQEHIHILDYFCSMFNLVCHSRIENNNKEKYIMQRESEIHPVMNLFLRNCTEKAGEHSFSFTQIKSLPH